MENYLQVSNESIATENFLSLTDLRRAMCFEQWGRKNTQFETTYNADKWPECFICFNTYFSLGKRWKQLLIYIHDSQEGFTTQSGSWFHTSRKNYFDSMDPESTRQKFQCRSIRKNKSRRRHNSYHRRGQHCEMVHRQIYQGALWWRQFSESSLSAHEFWFPVATNSEIFFKDLKKETISTL